MQGFAVDRNAVAAKMGPQLVMVEGAGCDADMIDVATACDRWGCLVAAGMGDVPENDQRASAPDLFHAERRIGVAGAATENVMIEADRLFHVVDDKDDVVNSDEAEGDGHLDSS